MLTLPPYPKSNKPRASTAARRLHLSRSLVAMTMMAGLWHPVGGFTQQPPPPSSVPSSAPLPDRNATASDPQHRTTHALAARLVPLPVEERPKVLEAFPGGKGNNSQLADSFEGTWYVHRGNLVIHGNFENTLNLVVEGDLIVHGTLTDGGDGACLVVTGDVQAQHVLTRQLMVVLGSLHCSGLVHADYNDYAFEVWGPVFQARALVLSDKSSLFRGKKEVEYEWDDSSGEPSKTKLKAQDIFAAPLVRWQDAEGSYYHRETEGNTLRYVRDDDEVLTEKAFKKLKKVVSIPADFETVAKAISEGQSVFLHEKAAKPLTDWRLDRQAPAVLLAEKATHPDATVRASAAGHPSLPAAAVQKLAADTETRVRQAAAVHPRLTPETATKLAADPEPDVRRVFASTSLAAPHLEGLVRDTNTMVRRAAASHPSLNDDQRRLLLKDAEKPVRARALRYLPVTAAWVTELKQASEEDLVAWAIQNAEDLPAGSGAEMGAAWDWKKDLRDERQAVREAALRRVSHADFLPFMEEHRASFVQDKSDRIRTTLAAATRDAATLTTLAQDQEASVRRAALDNLAVPLPLLIAEAQRLAKAPASSWDTSDPAYLDHSMAVHDLLKHPRLPAEAVRIIARVYPRTWRMEPVVHMPLDVILERALSNSASLEFAEGFAAWKKTAADPNADPGPTLAAFLNTEDSDLQSAARLNAGTPLPALLKHARMLVEQQDRYSLEDLARSPQLGSDTPDAEALRELLLKFEDGGLANYLAANPALPLPFLKKVAGHSPETAAITLWQVWGEPLNVAK